MFQERNGFNREALGESRRMDESGNALERRREQSQERDAHVRGELRVERATRDSEEGERVKRDHAHGMPGMVNGT